MRRLALVLVVGIVTLVACKPFDFAGDGQADLVIVDDDGNWYQAGRLTPIFTEAPAFGFASTAAGEYDGNKVHEPANVSADGVWHTKGTRGSFTFLPPPSVWASVVPGDYDGDGITEAAWFVADDATWYIEGEEPVQFGMGTDTAPGDWLQEQNYWLGLHDIPVPADYDGDGDDDLAVYRVTDGTFHVQGIGQIADLPLGFPAPADYDGDGDDEPVVYRDNALAAYDLPRADLDYRRGWYFGDGTSIEMPTGPPQLGETEVPVPTDYDGDGDDDLAVFALDSATFRFADGRTPVDFPDGAGVAATVRPWLWPEVTRLEDMLRIGGEVTPFDFAGDGAAKAMVVDYDGNWYEPGASAPFFVPTATTYPVPVAGDYDGDGRWEAAGVEGAVWETDGDRGTFLFDPVPGAPYPPPSHGAFVHADYDGDFTTDPAWYSEVDATWYIEGESPVQYGLPASAYPDDWQEVPLPADYDGDGEAELAVYRPTDGSVHVRGVGQVASLPLGFPVAVDFDGDGDDEPAVFKFLERRWYFVDGSTADVTVPGEETTPLPVPADFDGDGAAEPVVFDEPSTFYRVGGAPIVGADGLVDAPWAGIHPSGALMSPTIQLTFLQTCEPDPTYCWD